MSSSGMRGACAVASESGRGMRMQRWGGGGMSRARMALFDMWMRVCMRANFGAAIAAQGRPHRGWAITVRLRCVGTSPIRWVRSRGWHCAQHSTGARHKGMARGPKRHVWRRLRCNQHVVGRPPKRGA